MITKDLAAYAAENWGEFLSPVTELSVDPSNHRSLVKCDKQLYNFDKICGSLFPEKKKPTSADGIEITPRRVRLIEFKSGFRRKITRENFSEEQGRCDSTNQVCEKYWELFFKHQDTETHELLLYIRAKAVESFLTLEKQIFPLCPDSSQPKQLLFVAVIDADPVDAIEDIQLGLGTGQRANNSNALTKVRSALTRLVGIKDANGGAYCYDAVEVFSSQEYKALLSTP